MRSIEAPWQMTPAAACLKGHSCEKRSSNYVLDLDLKMQKYCKKTAVFVSEHCKKTALSISEH